MAEETKKDKPTKKAEQETGSGKPVSENQRFRYIGFDVYPGKPKDLFKSDAERQKWVDAVQAKREKGEIIREGCTLMEDRVSMGDKVFLVIGALAMVAALFLPWFSAYNEIVEEVQIQPSATEQAAVPPGEVTPAGEGVEGEGQAGVEGRQPGEEMPAVVEAFEETALDAPADAPPNQPTQMMQEEGAEKVIYGHQQRQKVTRETETLTGLGAFAAIGDAMGKMFSSGIILALTAVIMILFLLSCLVIPILSLVALFVGKGTSDEAALRLKRALRLAWLPSIFIGLAFILSFFGGSYSFDPTALYSSLGENYGVGVFLGSLTYGVIVALGGSFLLAAKGAEI